MRNNLVYNTAGVIVPLYSLQSIARYCIIFNSRTLQRLIPVLYSSQCELRTERSMSKAILEVGFK